MRKLTTLLLICNTFGQTPIFAFEPSSAGYTESSGKGSATFCDSRVIDRISLQVSVVMYDNRDARAAFVYFAAQKDQQDQQKQGWIGRHPVLFGALAGFGAGFALGYPTGNSAARGDPSSDYLTPEEKGLLFGGIGAGVGALIGKVLFHD